MRVIDVKRLAEGKLWLLFMYSKNARSDVERKLLRMRRETVDDQVEYE